MSDFSPETRNSAWWSSDTRRAVSGKALEVVLEKQGRRERENLDDVEHVGMGLRMQDTIARFAEDELNIRLKPLGDSIGQHPANPWFRCHGDFISQDNRILVECKNYNAQHIHHFSEPGDPARIPAADWAQCVHEAACFGVDTVILAVLFGGQRFRTYRVDVSADDKTALVQQMAVHWAHVQAGTLPRPETPEQCRWAYPVAEGNVAMADATTERAAQRLAGLKASIKAFEEEADMLQAHIQRVMGGAAELQSIDGRVIATWKNSKPTRRFDPSLFKHAMPDIYETFVVDAIGARRFLLKEKAE